MRERRVAEVVMEDVWGGKGGVGRGWGEEYVLYVRTYVCVCIYMISVY